MQLWVAMSKFGDVTFNGATNWADGAMVYVSEGFEMPDMQFAARAMGAKMSDYPDRTPNHWQYFDNGVWREWNPADNLDHCYALLKNVKGSITIDYDKFTVNVIVKTSNVTLKALNDKCLDEIIKTAIFKAVIDHEKYLEISKD